MRIDHPNNLAGMIEATHSTTGEEAIVDGKLSAFALVFVGGLFIGMLTNPNLSAQYRTGSTTQLLKSHLAGCDGKELTVTLNEFGPGTSGPHYHPTDSFTYILEGTEVYQIEKQSSSCEDW